VIEQGNDEEKAEIKRFYGEKAFSKIPGGCDRRELHIKLNYLNWYAHPISGSTHV
jgi:hypothetical protein